LFGSVAIEYGPAEATAAIVARIGGCNLRDGAEQGRRGPRGQVGQGSVGLDHEHVGIPAIYRGDAAEIVIRDVGRYQSRQAIERARKARSRDFLPCVEAEAAPKGDPPRTTVRRDARETRRRLGQKPELPKRCRARIAIEGQSGLVLEGEAWFLGVEVDYEGRGGHQPRVERSSPDQRGEQEENDPEPHINLRRQGSLIGEQYGSARVADAFAGTDSGTMQQALEALQRSQLEFDLDGARWERAVVAACRASGAKNPEDSPQEYISNGQRTA
jgi:hypothetical protein